MSEQRLLLTWRGEAPPTGLGREPVLGPRLAPKDIRDGHAGSGRGGDAVRNLVDLEMLSL